MENKIEKLSEILIKHSLSVEPDERVLIYMESDKPKKLVKYLIKKIYEVGGIPSVKIKDSEINGVLSKYLTEKKIEGIIKEKWFDVDNYDSFITIKCSNNDYEDKYYNVEMNKILGNRTIYVDNIRINKKKWVLLNFPSGLDAYKAKMTTDEYYEYAFDVMTIDYKSLENNLQPLKKLMEKTDKVRITGKNTDISFSIKDIPVVICAGKSNIPDGEVFTAPVKDSINGYITYNTASPYKGNTYHNIKLVFEQGKIIEATCDEDNEKLNKIFDTDEGAKYVGEFSLGVNDRILYPMGDILYDEKIYGSIHFTPGRAYQDAYNGNNSSIHWDLVLIQRKGYGGGNIYFDNVLIRQDGEFVLKELEKLNTKERK